MSTDNISKIETAIVMFLPPRMAVHQRKGKTLPSSKDKGRKGPPKKAVKSALVNLRYAAIFVIALIVSIIATVFVLQLLKFGTRKKPYKVPDVGIAIVTTWYGVTPSWANSWLRYHTGIGFNRIYLFFDNPKHDKELIDMLENSPEYKDALTIIRVDDEYRKKYWMPKEGFHKNVDSNGFVDPEQWLLPTFGPHIKTEHTARQLLNTARAALLAKSDNIIWLLHVDSDELFYVPGHGTGIAKFLFNRLDKLGITHANFLNDEVLPDQPDFAFSHLPQDPFHQRLLLKRNPMVLGENVKVKNGYFNQRAYQVRWERERNGVHFFLGYMCGKGAVNIRRWHAKNGNNAPVLPMHVVRFAVHYTQPGNVTRINNKGSHSALPYIDPSSVKIYFHAESARILHYVNPDFTALQKKFESRKVFREDIFDTNLIGPEERKLYSKTQQDWFPSEKMPSWEFYNEMWSRVHRDLKDNGHRAYDYYIASAVAPKPNDLEMFITAGLVYRTEEVRKFIQSISQIVESSSEQGKQGLLTSIGLGQVHVGEPAKEKKPAFKFYKCPKGPHYFCDVKDCCGLLTSPQFTFEKRLLGYIRYAAFQWWMPGLRWPQ